jgi:hypothetical protein
MALDPARLNEIVRPHSTVSDRIRALDAAGVPRADIARFLGKRYQHVRNVLEGDAVQGGGGGYVLGKADLSGLQEETAMFADDVDRQRFVQARLGVHFRLVIRPDGSIFVPAEVAASFGVGPGDILMGHISGDDFNLVSGQTALRRAQEAVRKMIPPGVNLADELIADRRREAEREEADD